MKTATVGDLRTRFPEIEAYLDQGFPVQITKQGRPVAILSRPSREPNFAERFGGGPSAPEQPVEAVRMLLRERGE